MQTILTQISHSATFSCHLITFLSANIDYCDNNLIFAKYLNYHNFFAYESKFYSNNACKHCISERSLAKRARC